MSATPLFPSPTGVPSAAGKIPGLGAGKASTALAIAFLAFGFIGCASSFCGAPCEAGAPPAARPVLPPENHFGTRHGHLETWNMSPAQLHAERAELESLLSVDAGDAALLKVLSDRKGGAESWIYDGFHAGGSRFRANGKLRREVGLEDVAKRTMIGIEESPRRDLFERYRLVRMQLLTLPGIPPAVDSGGEPAVDSAEVAHAEEAGVPSPDSAAARQPGGSLGANPGPDSGKAVHASPPAAAPWAGFYRPNSGAPTAAPREFAGLEECKDWAEGKADEYRREYFAFEFECRGDARTFRRKMW